LTKNCSRKAKEEWNGIAWQEAKLASIKVERIRDLADAKTKAEIKRRTERRVEAVRKRFNKQMNQEVERKLKSRMAKLSANGD